MRQAIKAKFEQNPELANQLIATGDKYLIEDSPKDPYWYVSRREEIGVERFLAQ